MSEKEKPLCDKAFAGAITDKGLESLTLHDRIKKYSVAKQRQETILNHLRDISRGDAQSPSYGVLSYPKIIASMSECFNRLVFHNYYTVDKLRLVKAVSCKKHLLCAPCAIRRAAKAVNGYMGKFSEIIASRGDLEPYLLTLTVKNGADLAERFEHLNKSMKSILKARRNNATRGNGTSEFCKIDGGVYSYELSHSAHGWHPHIHIVALVTPSQKIDFNPQNPKNSKLSKDWKRITGDSFIVDIRPITGDPVAGFIEVFKYALKFSDLTPSQTVEAYSYLHGKRLQGSFGSFRGVEIPDDLNEESIDDLPYIELIYKYLGRQFNLQSSKVIEI